jgi:trehalose synthase-fused probable maltokinase
MSSSARPEVYMPPEATLMMRAGADAHARLGWEDDGEDKLRPLRPYALARVRARAKMGLLYDAFANECFGQALVKMIARNARIPLGSGWLRFSATRAFAELAGDNPELLPIQRLALDSSNTTLNVGDRMLLKGYRRLQPGINPELEMGRFLTDVAGFPNVAPLAGALEYEDEDGNVITLALLQGFVANQGDAWSYTQDYLKRFLDDCRQPGEAIRTAGENAHASYLLFAATLGRRTGELPVVPLDQSVDERIAGKRYRIRRRRGHGVQEHARRFPETRSAGNRFRAEQLLQRSPEPAVVHVLDRSGLHWTAPEGRIQG